MTNRYAVKEYTLYIYNIADLKNIYEFLQVYFEHVNEVLH